MEVPAHDSWEYVEEVPPGADAKTQEAQKLINVQISQDLINNISQILAHQEQQRMADTAAATAPAPAAEAPASAAAAPVPGPTITTTPIKAPPPPPPVGLAQADRWPPAPRAQAHATPAYAGTFATPPSENYGPIDIFEWRNSHWSWYCKICSNYVTDDHLKSERHQQRMQNWGFYLCEEVNFPTPPAAAPAPEPAACTAATAPASAAAAPASAAARPEPAAFTATSPRRLVMSVKGIAYWVRRYVGWLHKAIDPEAEIYRDTAAALAQLDTAVAAEFAVKRRPGRPRIVGPQERRTSLKRGYNATAWQKRRRDKAETELKRLKSSHQGYKNRVTPFFKAKIALSVPVVSARGFAQSWKDFFGEDSTCLGRSAIDRIRDAFAEISTEMLWGEARLEIAALTAAAAPAAAAVAPDLAAALAPAPPAAAGPPIVHSCALLHIHDEAALRLRSFADADVQARGPTRSRTSKVQQHALWLYPDATCGCPLPCDLHALADKTAKTIATSIDGVMRSAADLATGGFGSAVTDASQGWFIHVLVGDGIFTNEAAARMVLARAEASPLAPGLKYFLMLVRCANHQANLAIDSAVEGNAALCGALQTAAAGASADPAAARVRAGGLTAASRASAPHRSVCANIVRLFKYLISDYYSEFYSALQQLVLRLEVSADVEDCSANKWAGLRTLYGEDALPEKLLNLLNAGCDRWVSRGAAKDSDGIRAELLEVLRKYLLVVDEHPTLTRMFTFRVLVDRCLLFSFLGIVKDVVKLTTVFQV